MKRLSAVFIAFLFCLCCFPAAKSAAKALKLPAGKLLYHAYTGYEAKDSKLYLYDFKTRRRRCISDELSGVRNAMNGDFGSDSNEIVFMGLTGRGESESWHVFHYDLRTRKLSCLTRGNGSRNEDPKFSPDGKRIVFKRGRWNQPRGRMVYDLYELTLKTKKARRITSNVHEESMPYYSTDGKTVYYALGDGPSSAIYAWSGGKARKVYAQPGVCCYYPIVANDDTLYFTKWASDANHADQLMRFDARSKRALRLRFNSNSYDCSDACPVGGSLMIISSTKGGGYDLYLADMQTGQMQALNALGANINSGKLHELGACYIAE